MNTAKIKSLKQTLDQATAAYDSEKSRLTEAGMKSADRYVALKELKAAQNAANSAYVKFTHGQIKNELNTIIEEDRPARKAAARVRSPWKQAKFDSAK